METFNRWNIIGIFLVILLVALSCSTTKKTALSCPELPRNTTIKKVTLNNNRHLKSNLALSQRDFKRTYALRNKGLLSRKNAQKGVIARIATNEQINSLKFQYFENLSGLSKVEYKNNLITAIDNSIIPINKTNSSPTVLNDAPSEMSKNENISDKNTSILVNTIFESDKTVLTNFLSTENKLDTFIPIASPQENSPKIEGLGLAGMIVGLVGLFILGIPCGIVAIVFGAISLAKIKIHPEKFKGKGFAIASLVLGIVDVVVLLILLAAV